MATVIANVQIPPEVFELILCRLSLVDLLCLRKTCKSLRMITEDYINRKFTRTDEITIDLETNLVEVLDDFRFLESYVGRWNLDNAFFVSPSKIYVKISDEASFFNEHVQSFVKMCGSKITHLRLDQLKVPLPKTELGILHFLESLSNLKELRIGCLHDRVKSWTHSTPFQLESDDWMFVPSTFQNLRTLKIETFVEEGDTPLARYLRSPFEDCFVGPGDGPTSFVWKFIRECSSSLEYLTFPTHAVAELEGMTYPDQDKRVLDANEHRIAMKTILEGSSRALKNIYSWQAIFPNKPVFKFLDLRKWYSLKHVGDKVAELCAVCALHSVKLLKVSPRFLEKLAEYDTVTTRMVLSASGYLTRQMGNYDLSNLEKFSVFTEYDPEVNEGSRSFVDNWSNLKKVIITSVLPGAADIIFKAFFEGACRRERLETLKLDSCVNDQDSFRLNVDT